MAVRNFYWLVDGILAGSARPGGDAGPSSASRSGMAFSAALRSDLDWLAGQGIRAVLSLTETPLPTHVLSEREMATLHLPIDDQTAPTQTELLTALDFIDQQRVAGRGVLVHCRVGEGRTATILAAYLIRQGATSQQAIDRLRAIRPGAISAPSQQSALNVFANGREWII